MTTPAAGPASHRPGVTMWLLGIACGTAVTMATPCVVLAGLLLAPGIGILLLEHERGRPTARVALLCGAAAAVAPLVALWQAGVGVSGALTAASDMGVLTGCWAAQGAGWLMAQLAPVLVRLVLDAHARTNMALLRAERARHEAEWDIPPAEGN